MNERYIKVFSGNEDLYVDDAPIMIRASALLKDTLTGKMIAQLKFQNISDNNIAYIKVRITQLDAINQQIDTPIDFEYLDILVSAKEEFGARTPIILSNPSARAFKVGVSCVGFSDGTVWKCENSDWVPALMESPVMKKLAAEETYQDAKTLLAYNTRESLTRAKELFESISSIKDVTVEIDSCVQKIQEANKQPAYFNSKLKKVTLILTSILGTLIICLLVTWIIFSISAASQTEELAVKHLSKYSYQDELTLMDTFTSYKHYTLGNVLYSLVQLSIAIVGFVLLFIKKLKSVILQISRITLSALNLVISVFTLYVRQPFGSYYVSYGFYLETVWIFHIINCILSALFLSLVIYSSCKTQLISKEERSI